MKSQEPFCAPGCAACRATDELVDRMLERQGARLHFLAQRVPGDEAVLAGDHGLGIVQREIGGADVVERLPGTRWQDRESMARFRVACFGRGEQSLRLLFQLFKVWAIGEFVRRHTTSMHQPCGSQTGSTAVRCRW